jgi:hypothetical protein
VGVVVEVVAGALVADGAGVVGVATGALVVVGGGAEVVVVAGGLVVVVGGGAGACAPKTGSPGTSMTAHHNATNLRGSLLQERVRMRVEGMVGSFAWRGNKLGGQRR